MTVEHVGVVVVTHASSSTVRATLDALPRERLAGTVVVDNDSPDDTADIVDSLPHVRVVRQPNRGFGAGCNRGVAELPAQARLVLFLNPDAVLEADDLTVLVDWIERHPRCAVVGPRVYSNGEPSWSAGSLATLRSELRPLLPAPLSSLGRSRRLPPSHAVSGTVGYVEGACFLVRRDVLAAVGGFDEGYFLYFEEMDLGQRMAAAGWEIHLCAGARVEHAIGVSRRTLPFAGRPHLVASCVRYISRWQGERSARLWVRAAQVSWALRARAGRLDHADAAAASAAAAAALTSLSHG